MKKRNLWVVLSVFLLAALAVLFASCTRKPAVLETPTELSLESEILTWKAVENADGYDVLVNDSMYESKTNTLDLFLITAEPGTYRVQVRAYSEHEAHETSKWSSTLEWDIASADLLFEPIDDGRHYAVKADPEHKPTGKLIIPSQKNGKLVTRIERSGFKDCEGISELIVPDNVLIVGSCAFQNCTGLERVYFADMVEEIHGWAFENCTRLREVRLPDTLRMISSHLFAKCSSLDTIELPGELRILEGYAFSETAIRSIVLPKSIRDVASLWSPFDGCKELVSVSVEEGCELFFSENNCIIRKKDNTLCIGIRTSEIPSCVKKINSHAFANTCGLTEITIPGTVENICEDAFADCADLRSITLEEGIKIIGKSYNPVHSGTPFWGCKSLTALHFPASAEFIAGALTVGCDSLTSLTVAESNKIFQSENNCIVRKEDRALIAICTASVFPDNIKIIENGVFCCYKAEELIIPEGVEVICNDAFDQSYIKRLYLPSSIKVIQPYAFYGMYGPPPIFPKPTD